MASRPIFLPSHLQVAVKTQPIDFTWAPGFSKKQKQRCFLAQHKQAKKQGIHQLLEVSSASNDQLGIALSAFSLRVPFGNSTIPMESAYQGSKLFAGYPQDVSIYQLSAKDSKKRIKQYEPAEIIGFRWKNYVFPAQPTSYFFDWLYYIAAWHTIQQNLGCLKQIHGFSDIYFNPKKGINCQAKALAQLLSIVHTQKQLPAGLAPEEFSALAYGQRIALGN